MVSWFFSHIRVFHIKKLQCWFIVIIRLVCWLFDPIFNCIKRKKNWDCEFGYIGIFFSIKWYQSLVVQIGFLVQLKWKNLGMIKLTSFNYFLLKDINGGSPLLQWFRFVAGVQKKEACRYGRGKMKCT
jgi:hypothetical protein